MADEVQYGPNPWQRGQADDPEVQQSVREDTGYASNTRAGMPAAAPAAPEPQPTYNSGVRFPDAGVIVNPETGQAFDIEPGPMRPEGRSGAVDPEERQLYTADAIERQNQYDSEYQDYVDTSNDPLDSSYYTQVVEEVNTDPVVELTPYDVSKMLPLSMKNKTDRKSFVLSNYPRLYEAALASGMNENEVYDVVNFTLAVDAAKRIGFTSNPARQRDLLSSMPAPQAGLVIDILNAWATGQQEQQVTPETAAEVANINSTSQVTGSQESKAAAQAIEPENILLRGGKLFWNATIGPTFDFLWMLTEGSMRVANTALLSGSGGSYGDLGPGQGDGGFWGDWSSAWEATDKGSYDPLMVYQLKNKYGAKPVDLLLTIKRMQIEGEEDIYSTILDRYAGDQEMLNLIEQAMVRSEQPDWMRSLDNELDAAETSNLGNTIAWGLLSGFGVNPTDSDTLETVGGNDLFQSTTKVINATGAVALDPTVGVGGVSKIVNGYKAARYSLAKMANGGPQTVFKYRAVRNHYNYLGAEFDKIRALDNTVDQANALDRLAAQNRKWYDYNALRTLYDSGIKNADDAYNFYTSIDALPTLLTGQAAKRPWEWTVPHTTKATAVAKAAAMKVRSLNPGTMNARQKVDEVFGAGTSELMPEDVAREIIRVIDEDPQKAGQLLSDIAYDATDGAVRTLAGRVVDRVAGVEKRGKWYDRYGWRKRGAATAEPGRVADRLGRLFAIMPDTSGGISVTDASGAELIKRYAQALNLDRSVANTLKFLWGELDVPSRIQLVNGLNRTAIYTTGMHLVDPQWADEFADMFSVATNPNVAYSAQMRDVVGARARAAQIVKQREEARLNPTRRDYDAQVVGDDAAWDTGPVLYHGTSNRFEDDALQDVLNIDQSGNLVGAGFYTTDSRNVAGTGYTKKGGGSNPALYSIRWVGDRPPQVLDGNAPAPEFVRDFFRQTMTGDTYLAEQLAPDAKIFSVLDDPNATSVDIVRAARRSMSDDVDDVLTRDFVDEYMKDLNIIMQQNGVDVFMHKGGVFRKSSTEEHNVYVWLDTKKLSVRNASTVDELPELKPLSKEQLRDEEMRVFKQLLAEEPAYNPAVIGDTAYAINDTQLTDTVALLNTQELMNYSAKSSFLNTLLFTGRRSSAVTDWWVLATLAGPRFVLRSGMEDAFLYALTDGSPRLYQTGRRVDRALRESSMRVPTKPNEKPRGKKLGVVPTATRRAADRFPILRGFFLDSLDDVAVKEAADAAVKNKDRSKLANLFAFGVARQRLLYHPNKWVRRLANWRYNKEINPTGYSNETVLSWLQDGVERGYLPHIIDDASETSRHLADGTFPAADDMLDTSVVEGVTIRHVPFRREPQKMRSDGTRYYTSDEPWKRNPRDMEAWYRELGDVLHYDGYKGQASIALSRRYYEAKVHLERTGDRSKLDEIIDSYTETLERDPRISEYVIAQDRGTRYLAEAKLEHALRLMTTANGKFNFPLFNKMRYKTVLDDGTEVTSYGLWRFEDGSEGLPAVQRPREYLVSQQDLASKDIPAPQSVRVIEDIQVPVSDKMPLSGQAWSTMGRALARLTRGPLASANFISARAAIEPFRLKMEAKVGKEAADEWAAKTAADRGLAMTMAYVDNPAIRSQFAWNVRNVARFYRALEDFYRRMMRVTTNKPETFWKIGLGWNILDDSGFVWEDEYGEKYFLFPGTNMAFNAVNGVARTIFGVQPVVPDLPVAYGSKVTMIMPSADPNQAVLTLGGPMGAFALKPLLRRFDLLTGLEPQLYGEYSAGQPLVSTLIQDAFGPNIRRLMDVAFAMGGDQESRFAEAETAFAAAAKKSIQAVAAAGIYDPTKDYTAEEMREIETITDAASINALWLQLILSPTLFTTPRLLPDDVTMLSREIGLDSLNAQFLEVVQNSENFDEAFVKYTRQNPGKAIFTISKYERTYNYEPIVETENFITKYQDEFDKRPQGMSFFSPTEGTYGGLKTFSFLRANGLKPSKTVENFWKETLGITGKQIYYAERAKYETELAAANTAEDRRVLNRAWAIRRDEIYRDYPDTEAAVEGSLRTSDQMSPSEYVDIIEEIRGSALFFAKQPETKERASEVLTVFETYDSARNDFERNQRTNPNYAEDNTINKDAWKSLVDQWGAQFAEDDRMLRLIRLMSAALDVEVEI